MIDILYKVNATNCIVIRSDGTIYSYEEPVEIVMDHYLRPLLLSFSSIQQSSKGILGESRYKKPISYYSEDGLNILIPTGSYRNEKCIWVSLNYCLHHVREDFNTLLDEKITAFQWSKLISNALAYKNMFDLKPLMPVFGNKISVEKMQSILKDYSAQE